MQSGRLSTVHTCARAQECFVGGEWAQWGAKSWAALSHDLMILSSSEPPAAQAPAPCQREGCPGDQVTAQPQVSHRTSVFHNVPVLLPDGVAAPPPCPGPLSSDPTSRDPCPRDQIIPLSPELFCWVMVFSFTLPRPSLCSLRAKPIPLPSPISQEHGLALRCRTVLF